MTDIDWDLNLIRDLKNTHQLQDEQDSYLDLMLQPITTQENFNLKHKPSNKEVSTKAKQQPIQRSKQSKKKTSSHNNNANLNQQSMKFRQYLSEKVQQLRKSKGIVNLAEQKPNQSYQSQNKKNSTLRNIIGQEQSKQQDKQKAKFQPSVKKQFIAQINPKQMQTQSIMPPIKPSFIKTNKQASDKNNQRKLTIDAAKFQQNVQEKDRRKTPESKNSFRIKKTSNLNSNNDSRRISDITPKPGEKEKQSSLYQGKSKKLREEFARLNEEQQKLQQQIFSFHKESRNLLENVMKKYKISTCAYQKYGITKDAQQKPNLSQQRRQSTSPSKKSTKESKHEKTSSSKIKQQTIQAQIQSPLRKQRNKTSTIDNQIQKLNNLLRLKSKEIEKLESKIERNAYLQFLRQQPEDIVEEDEDEEDEDDVVQELPQNTNLNSKGNSRFSQPGEFSSTYSTVMNEMKSKKWGLKQRITFQTHREAQQKRSNQKQSQTVDSFGLMQKKSSQHNTHPFPSQQQPNDQAQNTNNNKIQVNSRLRGLLFD